MLKIVVNNSKKNFIMQNFTRTNFLRNHPGQPLDFKRESVKTEDVKSFHSARSTHSNHSNSPPYNHDRHDRYDRFDRLDRK